jgi:hypothetical protein
MMETVAFLLTGEKTKLQKRSVYDEEEERFANSYSSASPVIIYGDTDSVYFKTLASNEQEAVEIADTVVESLNDTFKPFMQDAFLATNEFDGFIAANREIVASRGLFQAKKKYVVKIVDLEGKKVNKLKTMGSEIKKADTPKVIQVFLKSVVDKILDGQSYEELATFVNSQRIHVLKKLNVFSLGVAKQVNNLDKYMAEYLAPGTFKAANGKKLTIPGHARASCNYNAFIAEHDPGLKRIYAGDKVFIFYLRQNQFNFKALAFPAEMTKFPEWFSEHFKVDIKTTEDKMFDSKLESIFTAAYQKEVPTHQSVLTNSLLEF